MTSMKVTGCMGVACLNILYGCFNFVYPLIFVCEFVEAEIKHGKENAPIQPLPSTRRRSLTNLPPKSARWYRRRVQRTNSQSQSGFITKLPREIRRYVYEFMFESDGSRPLHVSITKGRLCGMSCHYQYLGPDSDCRGWEHGDECWGPPSYYGNTIPRENGDGDDSRCRAVGLLCCCRRIYAKAIDMLYTKTILNIRQTTALAALGYTMRPQRLRAFRTLHIDTVVVAEARSNYPRWPHAVMPHWDEAWKTVAAMEGLRELRVSLTGSTVGNPCKTADRDTIRHFLRPMMEVRVPMFEVVVYWPTALDGVIEELSGEKPFTIEVRIPREYQDL